MAFQSMAADSGGSYEPLQLEPFIHQVGGHSSMLQLDEDTICKPLIPQELSFYKSAPEELREFMAEYKGSIEVTFSEADDGYLDLTTYLPPALKSSSKPGSRQNSVTENERKAKHRDTQKYPPLKMNCYLPRIRLCQSGSIQIESISFDDGKKKNNEDSKSKGQNGSMLNPWVLHCHQKQMKRLQKVSSSTICQKYILLENRVSKYEFPCILDIKMGTRQYGDTMSLAKRQSHTAKAAASTSAILGLRISGMQVYQKESGHYTCHNKYYGRSLTVEGFRQAVYNFLPSSRRLRRPLVSSLLERLRRLHSVVQHLHTFRFYTSSLLVIYEGGGESSSSPLDLCMIDFAYSTHGRMPDSPVAHEGPDEGYLFGLENLIAHLELIQAKEK